MMEDQYALHNQELLAPGHRACQGCGVALATRHVLIATGRDIIVVTPTGCLETFTSPYGYSAWRVPWIHHLFENGPAIATGVAAALKFQGRDHIRVVVIGGDGSTFDIGFGSLSGMLDRDDDVLYVCVDNGAYMNTGGQMSGATPMYASTTTGPAGKILPGKVMRKKDLPRIVAAHGASYVATTSVAYLHDLRTKVQSAMAHRGARYIQIDTPCPTMWDFPSDHTLQIARMGVQCGLVPLLEIVNGKLANVRHIRQVPVSDYLKPQGRFQHLFSSRCGEELLDVLQALADANVEKYGLASGHRRDQTAQAELQSGG